MPERKAYPSDLTDAQWEVLEPLIPAVAEDATNVAYSRREIVNVILYVLRSGCPWRLVPHDLPAWGTVYWYASHAGETEVSGIRSYQYCAWRCAKSKAARLRRPRPSLTVNPSRPVRCGAKTKGYAAGKKIW